MARTDKHRKERSGRTESIAAGAFEDGDAKDDGTSKPMATGAVDPIPTD